MVNVNGPGELFGIDILVYNSKIKIILGIDYFTRKLYGTILKNKGAENTLKFLKKTFEVFRFKRIITDNGKEFNNDRWKDWCNENKVEHTFSIPYYHQGNGRIERANRTIRGCLKKQKKVNEDNLQKVLKNYNSIRHRAIGMSPEEAGRNENFENVKENSRKYALEFKGTKVDVFDIEDKVLIKKEIMNSKNDNAFETKGKVINKDKDRYVIKLNNGKTITRHATQLKKEPNGP